MLGLDKLMQHGIGVGSGLSGKRFINVSFQEIQPVGINVGDIWVKSLISHDIVFNAIEPLVKSDGLHWVQISNVNFDVDVTDAMEFVSREGVVVPTVFETIIVPGVETPILKLWTNDVVNMYTAFSNIRKWSAVDNKWLYLTASWWSGTKWVSFADSDYFAYFTDSWNIMKLSPVGTKIWGYGGNHGTPANLMNFASKVAVDKDGYSVVASGKTSANNMVIKFKPDGTRVWEYLHGDAAQNNITGVAISNTGFIYIYGQNYNKTIKLNNNGSKIWEHTNANSYQANNICVDTDNNLYTTAGDKINSSGATVWNRYIGNCKYNAVDENGDIIFTTDASGGSIAKYSKANVLLWTTPISINPQSIAVDKQGFIYCSSNFSTLIKVLNTDGAIINTINAGMNVNSINVDKNGHIYISEYNGSKFKKLKATGEVIWEFNGYSNTQGVAIIPGLIGAFPAEWLN